MLLQAESRLTETESNLAEVTMVCGELRGKLRAAEVGRLEAAAKVGELERGVSPLKSRLASAERADGEGRKLVARLAPYVQFHSILS